MTRSKRFPSLLLAGLVFGSSACGFRVPNTNEFFGTMTILCLLRSPLCFDCPYAGSWETVDTYRASAGEASNPTTMVGSGNRMFVAGRGTVGGTANWVVRTSEDGFSWQNDLFYQENPPNQSFPDAIIEDAQGSVSASGRTSDGASLSWTVLQRSGAGSWTVRDSYQYTPGQDAAPLSLMNFGSSTLAIGVALTGSAPTHSVVRRTDDGVNWSTVDDFSSAGTAQNSGQKLFLDPFGRGIFLSLYGESGGVFQWLIRRSVDGANSWSTVDTFSYQGGAGSGAVPRDMAADAGGNLYVAGWFYDSGNVRRWIVRRSADGVSWSTSDDFAYTAGQAAQARRIFHLHSGSLVVAGEGLDGSGTNHTLLRRTDDFGNTWYTWYDYAPPATYFSQANYLSRDATGALFMAANSGPTSANTDWIVRRLACR